MAKTLVVLASVLLLSGTAAFAADDKWPEFKKLDADSSGKISRVEWSKQVGSLKMDPAPTFEAMDADSNNGVDEDEWAAAEKTTMAYSQRCREATKSWCHEFK
jgi:hypothetical protein